MDADPVLATTADGRGVTKVSGSLVMLAGDDATLTAEGLRMTLSPWTDGEEGRADLVFEMATEPPLRVGYGGYLSCNL